MAFKVISSCLDSLITLIGYKKEMLNNYLGKLVSRVE